MKDAAPLLEAFTALMGFSNAVDQGFIACTASDSRIVFVNKAAYELLGYRSLESLLGTSLADMIPDAVTHPHRSDMTPMLGKEATSTRHSLSGAVPCYQASGDVMDVYVDNRVFYRAGGVAYMAAFVSPVSTPAEESVR